MYHGVSEVPERSKKSRSTNPAYSLTVNQFREQMEYLSQNGYKTLHLDQLLNIKAQVPQKSLVITFDDGWADNYAHVFPLLKNYSLTATIFVISGFVGLAKYMDWRQLREMSEAGFSIQSHTVNHKPLASLKNDQLMYELITSKKTIEDHVGTQVDFLSLPHGVFNRRVLERIPDAGYRAVCTSEPGFSHTYDIPAIFKRINISDNCEISKFEKIVEVNKLSVLPLIISKKNKNLIKKIVGYNTYRKIYRLRYLIKD